MPKDRSEARGTLTANFIDGTLYIVGESTQQKL